PSSGDDDRPHGLRDELADGAPERRQRTRQRGHGDRRARAREGVKNMKVLGISGSLRRDSHNRGLLLEAAQSFPAGVELELYDGLKDLPHYDQDDDVEPTPPEVQALRDAIAGADAVLIATPEYNGSVPGALKNAI